MSNISGFLSGLPISYDQEIVVILMLQKSSNDSLSMFTLHDETSSFYPVFLPIYCKYSEYSFFDVSKDSNVKFIEDTFNISIENFLNGIFFQPNLSDQIPSSLLPFYKKLTCCIELSSIYQSSVDFINSEYSIFNELSFNKQTLSFLGFNEIEPEVYKNDYVKNLTIHQSSCSSRYIFNVEGEESHQLHYIRNIDKIKSVDFSNTKLELSKKNHKFSIDYLELFSIFNKISKVINFDFSKLFEINEINDLMNYYNENFKTLNSEFKDLVFDYYIFINKVNNQHTMKLIKESYTFIYALNDNLINELLKLDAFSYFLFLSGKKYTTCKYSNDSKKTVLKLSELILKEKT